MKSASICEGLEGRTVDGKFPLLEWVGGWTDRCVFLTVRQALQVANIKVILASGSDADAYLAKWEAAKSLSHPSLVQMMETGRYAIEGKDLVYVVTEKADTFLSKIIPRKALDPDGATDVLGPIVDALSFLHEKGRVHGRVRPSNIVQVGNQWKLSADELIAAGGSNKLVGGRSAYDAPELATGNFTPAADVWSLGTIVVEAFAQRTPAWDPASKTEAEIPDSLPEPFLEIARKCVRRNPTERCSLPEVKTLLARHKSLIGAKKFYLATAEPPTEPVAARPVPPPVPAEDIRSQQPEKPIIEQPVAVERPKQPIVEQSEKRAAEPSYPFGRVEPVELPAMSRFFVDIDEEEDRKSHVGLILFSILVLLAGGGYFAVRQHWVQIPWPLPGVQQNAPAAANRPLPQTQAPPSEPDESKSAPPPDQTASPSQTAPQAQSSAPTEPNTSGAQPATPSSSNEPNSVSAEKAASPSAKGAKHGSSEVAKAESAPAEESPAPRAANAEGAVLKRVMPNVSPGAVASMRGPVEVEIRVSVNQNGAVSNAEYMTQGPGNYFARIARDTARSWKFTPPQRDGQPEASVWNLRFRFERRNTDVTATEIR